MLKTGEYVKIVCSDELVSQRLVGLVNQKGYITLCKNGNTKSIGAWVKITKGRNKGEEWFIPKQSIQTQMDVDCARNDAILRSIKI
jgi:hypothetical protein